MAKHRPAGRARAAGPNRWAARMSRTAWATSMATAGRASRTNDHFGGLELPLTAARLCGPRRASGRDCARRNWLFVRWPGTAGSPGSRPVSHRVSEGRPVPGHGTTPRKLTVQRRSNPVGATNHRPVSLYQSWFAAVNNEADREGQLRSLKG